MQLRILIAAAIYLGSYLPLSLILLAQDIDLESVKRGICPVWSIITLSCASPFKNPFWSLGAVAVCAMGMAATFVALRALRTTQRVKVIESKHIPADLINYVIPYVVSFISLDFEQGAKLIGFAVFLSWIFWITYRSGQIVLNPVLAAFGWKLFEVKYVHHGATAIFVGRMLSKVDIEPDRTYLQGHLQDVMVVRGNKGDASR
ncbi:hypothetical protein HNR01_002994 [Methylorubrum rhodesianum]|uniref:hypothetical protein n=1 Tax=Methylorubrum TaxID=2282523 RepID=UPI001615479A|nr:MULTISPECIES: hypothetical protein [Methylorubrum]MBB5763362.1 hypothetical protein [Methylorubrum rhodesianum]